MQVARRLIHGWSTLSDDPKAKSKTTQVGSEHNSEGGEEGDEQIDGGAGHEHESLDEVEDDQAECSEPSNKKQITERAAGVLVVKQSFQTEQFTVEDLTVLRRSRRWYKRRSRIERRRDVRLA